mmetsp:Transcript_22103/g.26065  ORF Transcript_22103/g.26065 Transcript_22103/m.26065 type:complete len:137 (+) Transcript_22103:70-480(+)
MPHGDFSDISAWILIIGGLQQIFKPDFDFNIGPLRGNFDTFSPEMIILTKISGSFLLIIGFALFTVRWNTINGKLTGFGFLLASLNIGHSTFNLIDNGVFILRVNYIYSCLMFLAGLHLMLNANPRIIPADESKSK